MAGLSKKIKGLTEKELKQITTPQSIEESTVVTPLVLTKTSDLKKADVAIYWLHARIKTKCYVLYAKYNYECKTTSDEAGNNRINVDKLVLEFNSGNGWRDKSGENTSQINKLDEVYATGNACKNAKMRATATIFGKSWTTKVPK